MSATNDRLKLAWRKLLGGCLGMLLGAAPGLPVEARPDSLPSLYSGESESAVQAESSVDLAAVQSTLPGKPSDLLQFTSAGHVLGFETDGVYVASGDHVLRVEFAGTPGVTPVSDQAAAGDAKAQPLGRVSYDNLWPGVKLRYEAAAGALPRAPGRSMPGPMWIRFNFATTRWWRSNKAAA